jgi:predicted nucleic acid-binding protein
LVRKGGRSSAEATRSVDDWIDTCQVCGVDSQVLRFAMTVTDRHGLQTYDAIIIASVAGHADILLSEDMQHGFEWQGVRIVNPFTDRNLVPQLS